MQPGCSVLHINIICSSSYTFSPTIPTIRIRNITTTVSRILWGREKKRQKESWEGRDRDGIEEGKEEKKNKKGSDFFFHSTAQSYFAFLTPSILQMQTRVQNTIKY